MTAWSTFSLTACEHAWLLVGRSSETLTVPNLKFPNYDTAYERSYSPVIFQALRWMTGMMSRTTVIHSDPLET